MEQSTLITLISEELRNIKDEDDSYRKFVNTYIKDGSLKRIAQTTIDEISANLFSPESCALTIDPVTFIITCFPGAIESATQFYINGDTGYSFQFANLLNKLGYQNAVPEVVVHINFGDLSFSPWVRIVLLPHNFKKYPFTPRLPIEVLSDQERSLIKLSKPTSATQEKVEFTSQTEKKITKLDNENKLDSGNKLESKVQSKKAKLKKKIELINRKNRRKKSVRYINSPVPLINIACTDPLCPCKDALIPVGEGYLYISETMVEFRNHYQTDAAFFQGLEELNTSNPDLANKLKIDSNSLDARLMCEISARNWDLDLNLAALDAKYWWENGEIPLRSTPITGNNKPFNALAIEICDHFLYEQAVSMETQKLEEEAYMQPESTFPSKISPLDDSPVKQFRVLEQASEWYDDPKMRGKHIIPTSEINIDKLNELLNHVWVAKIIVNPHKNYATKVDLDDIGLFLVNQLNRLMKNKHSLALKESVETCKKHLSAKCTGCSSNLTGNTVYAVSAMQLKDNPEINDERLRSLVEGECPYCQANEIYLVWQGGNDLDSISVKPQPQEISTGKKADNSRDTNKTEEHFYKKAMLYTRKVGNKLSRLTKGINIAKSLFDKRPKPSKSEKQ